MGIALFEGAQEWVGVCMLYGIDQDKMRHGVCWCGEMTEVWMKLQGFEESLTSWWTIVAGSWLFYWARLDEQKYLIFRMKRIHIPAGLQMNTQHKWIQHIRRIWQQCTWLHCHTLQTMAVFAPSLAACIHWLAPFPPKPMKNLWPWMVSPALGSLGAWLRERKKPKNQWAQSWTPWGLGNRKLSYIHKLCLDFEFQLAFIILTLNCSSLHWR